MEQMLNWVVNYGLGNVLALGIAFAFWRILIFVLKENSKREERLAKIIEEHLSELKQANSYQRDEHKSIMKVLEDLSVQIRGLHAGKFFNA